MRRYGYSFLFGFLSLISTTLAHADTQHGYIWLAGEQQGDGAFSQAESVANDIQTTHTSIEALSASSVAFNTASAWNYLETADHSDLESLVTRAIAAYAQGHQTTYLVTALKSHANVDGGFGSYPGYDSDPLNTALALEAFYRLDLQSDARVSRALAWLLARQKQDGSFVVTNGETYSSVYVTAQVAQAVQRYKNMYAVDALFTKARAFLSSQIDTNLHTLSVWEIASGMLAIRAGGTDVAALGAWSTHLVQQQSANGSWGGDVYSTALALQAIASLAGSGGGGTDPGTGGGTGTVSHNFDITGRVIDQQSGQPLDAAVIQLSAPGFSQSTTSGADGLFSFAAIPEGDYSLTVNATGHLTASRMLGSTGADIALGDIQLASIATHAVIKGYVTDSQSGQPISGAIVALSGNGDHVVSTSSNGYYEVLAEPGYWNISVTAGGYQSITASAQVVAGSQSIFSPALSAIGEPVVSASAVSGRIIDHVTSLPLSDVSVDITALNQSAQTSVDGRFSLGGLAAGEYTIHFTKVGYQPISITIIVPTNTLIDVADIQLMSLPPQIEDLTLQGSVKESGSGVAIPGALLSVSQGSTSARSDADGRYALAHIETMSFVLNISAPGYYSKQVQVTVPQWGMANLDVVLDKAAVSSVQITSLELPHGSQFGSNGEVELEAIVANEGTLDRNLELRVLIQDSQNQLVPTLIVNALGQRISTVQYRSNGAAIEPKVILAAGENNEYEMEWPFGSIAPGNYTMIFQVLDEQGIVLDEKSEVITVLPTQSIGGSITASPPVMQMTPGSTVEFSSQLTNSGNVDLLAGNATLSVTFANKGFGVSKSQFEAYMQVSGSPLSRVRGIALAANGDLYVANSGASNILKIQPDGAVSVYVALTGNVTQPTDVAIGADGTLYVSAAIGKLVIVKPDKTQQNIWVAGFNNLQAVELLPGGDVLVASVNTLYRVNPSTSAFTVYAGMGIAGASSMVKDTSGRIFIADENSNGIVVLENGVLSPWVSIASPSGMVLDSDGSLVVTSFSSNALYRIAANQTVQLIASGLSGPTDVELMSDGSYAIANSNAHQILKVTPTGQKSILAGPTVSAPVAVISDGNQALVLNEGFKDVRRLTSDTGGEIVLQGFNAPKDVLVGAGGTVYALVESGSKIVSNSTTGLTSVTLQPATTAKGFAQLPSGEFLLADNSRGISRANAAGAVSDYIMPQFDKPASVRRAASGSVYVLNTDKTIKKMTASGQISHITSLPFTPNSTMNGFAVSNDETSLFIADYSGKKLYRYDLASQQLSQLAALTFNPGSLTSLPDGTVLVNAYNSPVVYQISAAGVVTGYMTFSAAIQGDLLFADNTLYALGVSSMMKINVATGIQQTLTASQPSSLAAMTDGSILLAESTRLRKVSLNNSATLLTDNTAINNGGFKGAIQSADGHLWAFSQAGLLVELDANNLVVERYQSLSTPNDIAVRSNGSLLVADSAGLLSIDALDQLPRLLASGAYLHVVAEGNGNAILSSSSAILRWNATDKSVTTVVNGLSNISDIAMMPGNTIATVQKTDSRYAEYSSSGQLLREVNGVISPNALGHTPDGSLVVTGGGTDFRILFRHEDGTVVNQLSTAGMGTISNINTLPDGRLAFVGGAALNISNSNYSDANPVGFNVGALVDALPDGNNWLLQSSYQLRKYDAAAGTMTVLSSGLSHVTDMRADGAGNVYVTDDRANALLKIENNTRISVVDGRLDSPKAIAYNPSNDELAVAYVFNRPGAFINIAKYDHNRQRREYYAEQSMDGDIQSIAYRLDGDLMLSASGTSRDAIYRLHENPAEVLEGIKPGDLVYQNTTSYASMMVNGVSQSINLGNWQPVESGDYNLTVQFGGGVAGQLSNSLHIGPLATAEFGLSAVKVLPGDQPVSGVMHVTGIDTSSVTRMDPNGVVHVANSSAGGKAVTADTAGNIFVVDASTITKMASDGTVTTFASGVNYGMGLAADSHDNIYAFSVGSGGAIYKYSSSGSRTVFATMANSITGIAMGWDNTLYVLTDKPYLYKIGMDGVVQPWTNIGLRNPWEFTVDPEGNVIVNNVTTIDQYGHRGDSFVKIDRSGFATEILREGLVMESAQEGIGLAADCNGNVLFVPMEYQPFKPNGEEDTILQWNKDTKQVQHVLYGPSIDNAMRDMDSLYYDRFNQRLLSWTDFSNGKVFSFPIVCGGIDADVYLTTRGDVDMTGANPAPAGTQVLDDGRKIFHWALKNVDITGTDLNFNWLFKDLREDERRQVADNAYMQFNNSFSTGAPVRVPIALPSILAETLISVDVTTDNQTYGPHADVATTVVVQNDNGVAFSGSYAVTLLDADNNRVQHLAGAPFVDLAAGAALTVPVTWNTGTIYIGNYRVLVELLNTQGNVLTQDETPLSITLSGDIAGAVAAHIATDKLSYTNTSTVNLSGSVRNISENAEVSASRAVLTVASSSGNEVYTAEDDINKLSPGGIRAIHHALPLTGMALGEYQVVLQVFDAASGAMVADSHYAFWITQGGAEGSGLTGVVTVSAARVDMGQPLVCHSSVRNTGVADMGNVPLKHVILDMNTSAEITARGFMENLPVGTTVSVESSIDTTGYPFTSYACVLQAQVNGVWVTLGAAGFDVIYTNTLSELSGTVTVSAASVLKGDAVMCNDAILDSAPMGKLAFTATSELVQLSSGNIKQSESQNVLLQAGESFAHSRNLDTALLDAGEYACRISVGANSQHRQLAEARFTVKDTEQDINIDVSATIGQHGRLLVLLDAANYTDALDGTSTAQQKAWLEPFLTAQGWSYTITHNAADFARELATGQYVVYGLFANHVTLPKSVQLKLAAAVESGEGLLMSGQFNRRNNQLEKTLGITLTGREQQATGALLSAHVLTAKSQEETFNPAHKLDIDDAAGDVLALWQGVSGQHGDGNDHDGDDDHGNHGNGGHHGGGKNHHGKGHQIAVTANPQSQGGNHDDHDEDHNDHSGDNDHDGHHDGDGCGDDASDSTEPAMIHHAYGTGHTVFAGFDLLDEATLANNTSNIYARLLAWSLKRVEPVVLPRTANNALPLMVHVENKGSVTEVRYTLSVSGGDVVAADGWTNAGNGQWQYSQHLAADGNVTLPAVYVTAGNTGAAAVQLLVETRPDTNAEWITYQTENWPVATLP